MERPLLRALCDGHVIAESTHTRVVEGNFYFPPGSVRREYFHPSKTRPTQCTWKGLAHWFNVVHDGKVIEDAAWIYPDAKPEVERIRGYVAFASNRVQVVRVNRPSRAAEDRAIHHLRGPPMNAMGRDGQRA
mmetsp:Transcript_7072/g.24134  ORF Transcript_7072/g.24134 Transcript_7072/m.24134 type:complete len:132 (+) Transcript_7072:60-455(+)